MNLIESDNNFIIITNLVRSIKMSLINNLCLRLERHPKRVVFPEGNDVRILQAARKFAAKKLGIPILLGNRIEIKELANKLDIKLDHIRIIDPLKSEERPRFKQFLQSIYRFKDKGEIDLEALLNKNTYFAALMLATSQTDAMVAGANSQASSSLRPLLQIIPFQNKNKLISSLNIFDLEDQTTGKDKELFLADCAVVPEPTIEQLAQIAINTAALSYQLTNKKPKVAFLSYSSQSNSKDSHASIQKMKAATQLAKQLARSISIDMDIDGELQLDAALDPRVAENKSLSGTVAGNANVLIFPDLQSANIASKAINYFTHSRQYGPILTGFSKPAAEISRGTYAGDIFGTAVMVASQAIDHDLLYPTPDNALNEDIKDILKP